MILKSSKNESLIFGMLNLAIAGTRIYFNIYINSAKSFGDMQKLFLRLGKYRECKCLCRKGDWEDPVSDRATCKNVPSEQA